MGTFNSQNGFGGVGVLNVVDDIINDHFSRILIFFSFE